MIEKKHPLPKTIMAHYIYFCTMWHIPAIVNRISENSRGKSPVTASDWSAATIVIFRKGRLQLGFIVWDDILMNT